MPNTVQSLERALDLLEAVARSPEPRGVRELARELGLKAPTAQQLLSTLRHRGYLEMDPPTRRYLTGPAVHLLAERNDPVASLRNRVGPHLEWFHARNNESILAQALIRGAATIVDERRGGHPLGVTHGENVVRDPDGWASGRVLLAWQEPGFVADYMAARGWPRERADAFLRDLGEIRRRGIALLVNHDDSGVAAFGVPALGSDGSLLLAVGSSVPLSRLDPELEARLQADLLTVAGRISSPAIQAN